MKFPYKNLTRWELVTFFGFLLPLAFCLGALWAES
jgi:hypothetical protein